MGRDWYNEVAARPGGYSVSWPRDVEGPNAQAIFDELVLKHAGGLTVLDCGCGDGAFTVRVAEIAERVVALDFAEKMLDRAREEAAKRGARNIEFVLSHARVGNPLPKHAFDLAYSRRGPQIVEVVPELVRPDGLLLAIHPVNEEIRPEIYAAKITQSGLTVEFYEVFNDLYRFHTLEDLAKYLSRQPGMPDLRIRAHRGLLEQKAQEFAAGEDYVIPLVYLVWIARTGLPVKEP